MAERRSQVWLKGSSSDQLSTVLPFDQALEKRRTYTDPRAIFQKSTVLEPSSG